MILRNGRQSWPSTSSGKAGSRPWRSECSTKPLIDYDKLRRFCAYFTENESPDHLYAMKKYPSTFVTEDNGEKFRPARYRPHTCCGSINYGTVSRISEGTCLHDIKTFTAVIHNKKKSDKDYNGVSLKTEITAILAVTRKLPMLRDESEIQQLSKGLKFFSHLFPIKDSTIVMDDLFTGLAKRATLEELPGSGYALEETGGLYVVLQGSVERISQDKETKQLNSSLVCPGKSFGDIKSSSDRAGPITWQMYPQYVTATPCSLLYINASDYSRITQNCRKLYVEERQELLKSCPLLDGMSPAIISKLTEDIMWETIPANTTIVQEGDHIDRVMFIKEGRCSAMARVTTSRNLHINVGELRQSDCIGEALLLSGVETHPYSIISSTQTVIGIISFRSVKLNELRKYLLSGRILTLPILTKKQIRDSYYRKVMTQQWCKIKNHILEQVVVERGIQYGTKKWKHTPSEQ